MLERNKKLLEEQERLEKGGYTGQTVTHWLKGVARMIDFPKKPISKELNADEKVGGTNNE